MSLAALEEETRNHIEGNIYDREHNPDVSKRNVFFGGEIEKLYKISGEVVMLVAIKLYFLGSSAFVLKFSDTIPEIV